MPRLGVLGGTFDPIHVGHLAAADHLVRALALDRVVFVPTNAQPLKPPPTASAADRLEMCRLAVKDEPRFVVSSVDIDRGGATFTVDTLADLAREFSGDELVFVTGADSLATFARWRDPDRILELAEVVGFTRAGHALDPADARLALVEVPELTISSTDVRNRVRAGAPIRDLVPDPVRRYVEDHGLYRGGTDD